MVFSEEYVLGSTFYCEPEWTGSCCYFMQSLSKKKLPIFFPAADNGRRNATLNESFAFCSLTSSFLDVKVINHRIKQQQGSLLITAFSTLCNHSECKWHCRSVDFFKIWNLHFLLSRRFAWIEGNLQVLDLSVWLWEWCGFWLQACCLHFWIDRRGEANVRQ